MPPLTERADAAAVVRNACSQQTLSLAMPLLMCGAGGSRASTFAAPERTMARLLPFLRRHLLLLLALGWAVAAWASAGPRIGCAPKQPYHHPLGRILAHGAHTDSLLGTRRGSVPRDTCAAEEMVCE